MSKGLSLADIFYLQAIYAATIVLLEAPSGYFADLFGRRTALLIGSVGHGLAYFYLNFAIDLNSLIVFEIGAGVAASLLSEADLAVLYDTQKALQGNQSSEHSKGRPTWVLSEAAQKIWEPCWEVPWRCGPSKS